MEKPIHQTPAPQNTYFRAIADILVVELARDTSSLEKNVKGKTPKVINHDLVCFYLYFKGFEMRIFQLKAFFRFSMPSFSI